MALALVPIARFTGAVTYGVTGAGIEIIDGENGMVGPATPNQHPKFDGPGTRQTDKNSYDMYVVVRQFVFKPGTVESLRVPAGNTVISHVIAVDVIHGSGVVDTSVNTMAIPGQVSKFTVQFEEAGGYGILCSEYCGSGHHVVKERIVAMGQGELDSWYEQ